MPGQWSSEIGMIGLGEMRRCVSTCPLETRDKVKYCDLTLDTSLTNQRRALGAGDQSDASHDAPLAVVISWSPIISPGPRTLIECVKTRTKRAKCDLARIKALHQSHP